MSRFLDRSAIIGAFGAYFDYLISRRKMAHNGVKPCKTCRHSSVYTCLHPQAQMPDFYGDGMSGGYLPIQEMRRTGACGVAARLWEAKT